MHVLLLREILSLPEQVCDACSFSGALLKLAFSCLSCRHGDTVERYGPEPHEAGFVSPVYIALG